MCEDDSFRAPQYCEHALDFRPYTGLVTLFIIDATPVNGAIDGIRRPSFMATPVDGWAIFVVTRRGSALLSRQALHDPSCGETRLSEASAPRLFAGRDPMPRSSRVYEQSQHPIDGAPSYQPKTRVPIQPRPDYCSVYPGRVCPCTCRYPSESQKMTKAN